MLKDGTTLVTLAYSFFLPSVLWQRAAELMIQAAEDGAHDDERDEGLGVEVKQAEDDRADERGHQRALALEIGPEQQAAE